MIRGISGHVSSESKEECLRSKLQGPDTDFLYTPFAYSPIIKDIAGKGIVHLIGC